MQITTCQICGRAIKSKSGKIAHHGYQRPYEGYQTSSCFGARYQPYEVACDALPPAIKGLEEFVAARQKDLEAWINNPPPGIYADPGRYGRFFPQSALRPKDFQVGEQDYRSESYRTLHYRGRFMQERTIKHASEDLAALKKRLADWRPQA